MTHSNIASESKSFSPVQIWLEALRPKTLPAGAAPVVLGSALAFTHETFSLVPALVALVCALFIQILSNFINEIYDHRKGADTEERLGPTRAVAKGLIPEKAMIRASVALAASTFFIGLYLVYLGGWPIFVIGLFSLFFAWAYTGGPYPLAYKGVADFFVFIFFGVIAVCGTYYLQAGTVNFEAFMVSITPGALSMNILGVNNIRDIHTDPKAGKITMAVRLGAANAKLMYVILLALSFIPAFYLFATGFSFWILIQFLALPLGIKLIKELYALTGSDLNRVLAGTAKFLAISSLLLSLGLILAAFMK
jgi:1,4-dihydroxy-2-naphthoate octaprenyltransferase